MIQLRSKDETRTHDYLATSSDCSQNTVRGHRCEKAPMLGHINTSLENDSRPVFLVEVVLG